MALSMPAAAVSSAIKHVLLVESPPSFAHLVPPVLSTTTTAVTPHVRESPSVECASRTVPVANISRIRTASTATHSV